MSFDPASDDFPGNPPDDLAVAGTYSDFNDACDHGLVVLAMGLPYWLEPEPAGFRLLVEAGQLEAVREQLACFDRESVGWPPQAPEPVTRGGPRWLAGLAWAALLLAAYNGQRHWPDLLENLGQLDARAVLERDEWWRPLTALFLHADAGHLTSNLLIGYPILSILLGNFGRWRGWSCFAFASVAGNVIAVALHRGSEYRSIGASTSVFAAIGLLTGAAVRVGIGAPNRLRWRAVLVPVAAGLMLLGFLGSGGIRTDIVAHAAGFLAGLVVGFVAAPKDGGRRPKPTGRG